jgi:DNA-binding MarR family transcriptional regulator
MHRDIDPRSDERERERPDLARGGQGATDEERSRPVEESRDAFSRNLDLPRGSTRERIRIDGRDYALRGSEVRTLGTVGAFRVVPAEELRRPAESVNALRKDLDHLRDLGLVRTMPYVVGRERTTVVTLTDRGRALLESARRPHDEGRQQTYYAGIAKERELAHDSRVHRAYADAADRLFADGGRVRRVVLEHELKREYQSFLQAPNRGRKDSSGRPQRDAIEIARWAEGHNLPLVDGHVQFPDVRIEFETRDGRLDVRDIEVMTPHYRGAHASAKVAAGFARYHATGARLGGGRSSTRAGRARESRLAEEMLG